MGVGAGISVSLWEAAEADEKISFLKQDIERIRAIQTKTASHILQMEDIKYEAIEKKFNEVKKEEIWIQLETEINAFENSMVELIDELRMRYQDAVNSGPRPLIEEQIAKVKNQFPKNKIVISADDIMRSPPMRSVRNGYLTLTWVIPIMKAETMERVAFVSVPENGSAIAIEEGKLVARKIIDRKRRLQTIKDT